MSQAAKTLTDLTDAELRNEHARSLDLIEAALDKTLRHAAKVLDLLKSRHKELSHELKRRGLT